MGVNMRFFRHVAEGGSIAVEVEADTLAFKEYLAGVGFEQPGDDFDGRGFAGAVGADVADYFAGPDGEGDVVDCGKATVAFAECFDFEHAEYLYTLCSIQNRG